MSSRRRLAAVVAAACIAVFAALTAALAAEPTGAVRWERIADMPYRVTESNGVVAGGRLYSFGGYDQERIEQQRVWTPRRTAVSYDPATGTWARHAELPAFDDDVLPGVTHAAVAASGSTIYLAGGYPSTQKGWGQRFSSRRVFAYDTRADAYDRLPDLPEPRGAAGAAVVDGKLHVFGGSDPSRANAADHWALDLSDPSRGWRALAPLAVARNHVGYAVIDGRIYVVGGQVGQDREAVPQSSLEIYDPETDRWSAGPRMPVPLSHTVADVLDGRLVVLAGDSAYRTPNADVLLFDPAARTWTPMTKLPLTRVAGIAGVVGGDLFYAAGSGQGIAWRGAVTRRDTPAGSTPRPGPATPTPAVDPGPVGTPSAPLIPTGTPAPADVGAAAPLASTTGTPSSATPAQDPPATSDLGSSTPTPAPSEAPGGSPLSGLPRVDAALQVRTSRRGRHGVRLRRLRIARDMPGLRVTITCKGGSRVGCPAARPMMRRTSRWFTIQRPLVPRTLTRGAVVEVRVRRAGHVGRLYRVRVLSSGRIRTVERCLVPQQRAPQRCS